MPGTLKRSVMMAISLAYASVRGVARAAGRLLGANATRSAPVVMTYHSVRAEDVPRFSAQMRHLKRRAATVFVEDAETTVGAQTVAVTFDDAFQNVFDHALPIMATHDIPATIFAPSGYLGDVAGWIEDLPGGPCDVAPGDRLAAADRRRVRIESHTVTHPHLARLATAAIRRELAESKRALERLTGTPVRMLALPFGSCSTAVLDEARAAGYARVFANVPVRTSGGGGSLLRGRINVTPNDWPLEFRLKAGGAYDWMATAIPAKQAVLALLGRTKQQ